MDGLFLGMFSTGLLILSLKDILNVGKGYLEEIRDQRESKKHGGLWMWASLD